jgi:hypothetical protein
MYIDFGLRTDSQGTVRERHTDTGDAKSSSERVCSLCCCRDQLGYMIEIEICVVTCHVITFVAILNIH